MERLSSLPGVLELEQLALHSPHLALRRVSFLCRNSSRRPGSSHSQQQDDRSRFQVCINCLCPVNAGGDTSIMPEGDETLLLEQAQVRFQLPQPRFVCMGITTK